VSRAAALVVAMAALAACEGATAPTIERLEPAAAARGATVTLRGAGFCGPDRARTTGECASPPSGAVELGLAPPMTRAPILSWSDAAISVQVPATLAQGPIAVIVTVDGRSSNAATLEVTP
jgi:uncharacterized protein (TIGR03437 family)